MKMNMMELSKFVKWSVFGDGYVGYSTNNLNAHYSISRHPNHYDYLDIIASKFDPLIKVTMKQFTRNDNGKDILQLTTSSHPIFSRIRDRQYIEGHRVLDPHMLTLLDWECLAFLYQDDGSLCFNNKNRPIVRISTCTYSYFEQIALRKALMEKFDLCFNVNRSGKDRYQLNLRTEDHNKFFEGIYPFIAKSYLYKFPAFLQKEAPVKGDDLVYVAEHR